MSDIFISHSCKDAYLAEKLITLLVNGLDIKKSDVFCSSIYGTISSGSDFANIIRNELLDCKLSVLIVTKNYLDSQFCLAELGAIWAIDKPVLRSRSYHSGKLRRCIRFLSSLRDFAECG